jgi:hypothetical protein
VKDVITAYNIDKRAAHHKEVASISAFNYKLIEETEITLSTAKSCEILQTKT